MILEKLTDDEVFFSFFDCKILSFFAMSLFNMIVTLSAITSKELDCYFEYSKMLCLQKHQTKYNIPNYGNTLEVGNL